jgi:nucleotide-binding universal stress UspA family protein
MTTATKPYVIVAGIDFSAIGDAALNRAFELASNEENGEVHVVYVARAYGPLVHLDTGTDIATMSMDEASNRLKGYVEERLAKFVTARSKKGQGTFSRAVTHIRLDAPAEEIAQLASDLEAQLVVIGTHGRRGVRRLLLGSVAEGTVRLAPCPVLVVRPTERGEVPEIEPPCPACVDVRAQTNGEELWCPRHKEHHGRRHVYHSVGRLSKSRERLPGLGSND